MNSTPVNSAAIIRLTALLPPPPRPMTLIFAACGTSSSSKSGRRVRSLSITSSFRCLPAAAVRRRPGERVPSDGNSGGCSPRPVLKDVIQKTGQAPREPSEQAGDEGEDLLDPRLDELREDLARELAGLPAADRRHVHGLLRRHQGRQRAPVPLLQVLGRG